jgi:hypothetical protein
MKPYITSIDRTNPIGNIIGDYGEYQFNKGFMIGHISGICVGAIIVWAILSKKVLKPHH